MKPLDFLELGIAVIPVLPKSKIPEISWRRYQDTLPTPAQFGIWFRPGRPINAAVICGWQGLTVLDFDDAPHYVAWQAWAIAAGGVARRVALNTYRVRTSRGMHVYLFLQDVPRCGHFQWGEYRGHGGYVLIPPSVHPSGIVYQAENELAPIAHVQSLADVIPDPPAPPVRANAPTIHVFPASSVIWPATVIDQIKERVDILSLVPDARASGGSRWYMAHCPLHDDRRQSLRIDTRARVAYCWAGCNNGQPMDVISFYAQMRKLTNKDAIRELAKRVS